jgi:septal ring factor EnvC (AmiA/AmiB activator)
VHQPPDVPSPPAEAAPDERPATQGDVRTLRRWLVVAGIWAVAATAIALLALLSDDESDSTERERALSRQISAVQRELRNRLDSVDEQIDRVAKREDVSKLERRLGRAEDDASKSAKDAKSARDELSDLEGRVESLEEQPPESGGGSGGSQPDNAQPNMP